MLWSVLGVWALFALGFALGATWSAVKQAEQDEGRA